jgi:hypothetical protein
VEKASRDIDNDEQLSWEMVMNSVSTALDVTNNNSSQVMLLSNRAFRLSLKTGLVEILIKNISTECCIKYRCL